MARARAENYLRKAEAHLAAALESLAASRWDSAVLLALHAAISAADAVCVASRGVRSMSPTHMDQVKLLRQLFPGDEAARKASNQLADLLDRKNAVEYEARLFKESDAEVATKQAERVVVWARRIRSG